MKVYTKVVINMTTMQTIEEEFYEYHGEITKCFGAGPSGAIDFPTYMKNVHALWLYGLGPSAVPPLPDTNVLELMEIAWGSPSPFEFVKIYDPDTALDDNESRYNSSETIIDALSAVTDYDTLVANAKAEADNVVVSETEISDAVTAYKNSVETRHLDNISNFTSGMADVNAVHSSQFIIGLALLEREREHDVSNYEANLRIQIKRDKMVFIGQAVSQMLQVHLTKASMALQLVATKAEVNRLKIVAKNEEVDRTLDLQKGDALWDLQIMQLGSNLLATIAGSGQPEIQGMSRTQSALSGALSGAAMGASTGNPLLAGIGFVGGGLAGLLQNR